MIGERIVEFEDLQKLSKQTQLAAVERWATNNGVPFKRCRGGIWTTTTALDRALGLAPANDSPAGLDPDLIG